MAADALNPSTLKARQKDRFELKASLVYKAGFRITKAVTYRNTVLETNTYINIYIYINKNYSYYYINGKISLVKVII